MENVKCRMLLDKVCEALLQCHTSERWYPGKIACVAPPLKNQCKEALRALFCLDTSVRWYDVKEVLRTLYLKNLRYFTFSPQDSTGSPNVYAFYSTSH